MKYSLLLFLLFFLSPKVPAQKGTGEGLARRTVYGIKEFILEKKEKKRLDSICYQGDTTEINGRKFISEDYGKLDWFRSYFQDENIDSILDRDGEIFYMDSEIKYTYSLLYKGSRPCAPNLIFPPDSCFQKAIRSSLSPETVRKIKLILLSFGNLQLTPVFLCGKDGKVEKVNFIAHRDFQMAIPHQELTRLCTALKQLRFGFDIPDCYENKPVSSSYKVYIGYFLGYFQRFFGGEAIPRVSSLP